MSTLWPLILDQRASHTQKNWVTLLIFHFQLLFFTFRIVPPWSQKIHRKKWKWAEKNWNRLAERNKKQKDKGKTRKKRKGTKSTLLGLAYLILI